MVGAEGDKDPVLERTRREVRLLDDVYKTAVVLITKHYVNESSDLSAGQAAKALFAGIKEKGWHEARLVDATGEPLVKANAPQPGFEQEAVKRLKANEPYYDQVIEEDGKKFLPRRDAGAGRDGEVRYVPRELSQQQGNHRHPALQAAARAVVAFVTFVGRQQA